MLLYKSETQNKKAFWSMDTNQKSIPIPIVKV